MGFDILYCVVIVLRITFVTLVPFICNNVFNGRRSKFSEDKCREGTDMLDRGKITPWHYLQ